jgi:hypothetical protein
VDTNGKQSASIQLITDQGTWCTWHPYHEFHKRHNHIQIGENQFNEQGLTINLKTDEVTAFGNLSFGPLSSLRYDIMGPFRYIPLMECRHSVYSMAHTVQGRLVINGTEYVFDPGVGYIEGDRGRSFPSVYAWTQCLFSDTGSHAPCSIMMAVADIPFAFTRFTGITGVIQWRGKQYRIATYLGARVIHIGKGEIIIKQGCYQFSTKLIHKQEKPLYAPVCGGMTRIIHEDPSCSVYYCFKKIKARYLSSFQTVLPLNMSMTDKGSIQMCTATLKHRKTCGVPNVHRRCIIVHIK